MIPSCLFNHAYLMLINNIFHMFRANVSIFGGTIIPEHFLAASVVSISLNHSSVITAFAFWFNIFLLFLPGRPFVIFGGWLWTATCISSVCLFVYLWVDRRRAETGGAWGGEHHWGWGGLWCNMMFILVMYLTVEDNRGLSGYTRKTWIPKPKHSLMNI